MAEDQHQIPLENMTIDTINDKNDNFKCIQNIQHKRSSYCNNVQA